MSADRSTAPAVGFVGFQAERPGAGQPTPAEALAGHLHAEGWRVVGQVSRRVGRAGRLTEQAMAPLRWRACADVLIVDVFSGRSFLSAEAAMLTARAAGVPVVLVLHGGGLPTWAGAHRTRARRLLGTAAAVVAPSTYLADLAADLGAAATVIPNTVELGDVTWRDRAPLRPRVLWLRSFAPLYRPLLAVEVLAELVRDVPDLTVTMAGADKGLRDAVRASAVALGVEEHLELPGFLGPAARDEALADHDVLLNTNAVDNMPVSLLEAMACGLVVVTTDAGGIPHVVADGVHALVRPVDDGSALAGAVRDVLTDEVLARRLAAGGRALTDGLRWPAVRERWLDVLSAAAASGSRARR